MKHPDQMVSEGRIQDRQMAYLNARLFPLGTTTNPTHQLLFPITFLLFLNTPSSNTKALKITENICRHKYVASSESNTQRSFKNLTTVGRGKRW